jgi:hypothetical protein
VISGSGRWVRTREGKELLSSFFIPVFLYTVLERKPQK